MPFRLTDRRARWGIGIGSALLVLILFSTTMVVGIWRAQWDSPFARLFARVFPVPAAQVGNTTVSYVEYLRHADAEAQFLSGPAARVQGLPDRLTPALKRQALERAMRIAAVDAFAAQNQIVMTPLDVERAYENLLAQAPTSTTPDQIRSFLHDEFGWDEQGFKAYVVRPALIEDTLNQKFSLATRDPQAFQKRLDARLKQPDVKVYLTF